MITALFAVKNTNHYSKIMATEKYEIRKTTVADSNALIVHKNNETVMYIKPYAIDAITMTDVAQAVLKFLNKQDDNNQS